MCGEQLNRHENSEPISGSSPRVRGTGDISVGNSPLFGIIPACAGNSYYIVSKGMAVWDHPRVCGEQR